MLFSRDARLLSMVSLTRIGLSPDQTLHLYPDNHPLLWRDGVWIRDAACSRTTSNYIYIYNVPPYYTIIVLSILVPLT